MGRFLFVSLALLVVAFSLTGARIPCPKGWYHRDVHCYKVFSNPKNWNHAEAFCWKHGEICHLSSIQEKLETDDMANYVKANIKSGQSVWIGLHDPSKTRDWKWTNQRTVNYLAWANGKPDRSNDSNKSCVKLEKETEYLQWSDSNCEELYPFLCQC